MGSSIPYLKRVDFEEWVIEHYPNLFSEWETEAAEFMDIDEWMERTHYNVIAIWHDSLKALGGG